GERLSSSKLK
ncbi:unnamed protein product, partial [Rotaria sp. Silwood2]